MNPKQAEKLKSLDMGEDLLLAPLAVNDEVAAIEEKQNSPINRELLSI